MKLFNAFQITGAFVAMPFLIAYLSDATFRAANVAFFACCGLYVVAFMGMVMSVYAAISGDR